MSWKTKRRKYARRKGVSTMTPQKHLTNLVYSVGRRGPFNGDLSTVRTWLTGLMAEPGLHCMYCIKPMAFVDCSVDHAIPVSRGGPNGLDNLVVCCKFCNKAKGDMNDTEYRQLLEALEAFDDNGSRVLKRLVAAGNMFRRWRR